MNYRKFEDGPAKRLVQREIALYEEEQSSRWITYGWVMFASGFAFGIAYGIYVVVK